MQCSQLPAAVMQTSEDGRVARGQRTREAIISALFELYREGNLTPTIEQIAERVGCTTRAIYQHFQDKEALVVAIAERQLEAHAELYRAAPIEGVLDRRISGIVGHRSALFEAVAPVRRSALVQLHISPELQRQQTGLAGRFRNQLATTFEPELGVLETDLATHILDLLDLHTSWETWERLRTWQRLSVDRTERIVTILVTNAITP